jgi:ORF6N domain
MPLWHLRNREEPTAGRATVGRIRTPDRCSSRQMTGQHAKRAELAPAVIRRRILVVRERQVMLDSDLAGLYGVETRRLIEQVKRNIERFPADFMFQLTKEEAAELRSQNAISNPGRGGRRYAPYVFTEQGVAMLSSVLKSKQAAAVNVEIMRAFVELRRMAHTHAELSRRVDELEEAVAAKLGEHDEQLQAIFKVLREVTLLRPRKRRAGFVPSPDD